MLRCFHHRVIIVIVVLMPWALRLHTYSLVSLSTQTATNTPIALYAPLIFNNWSSTVTPSRTPTPTYPPAGDLGWRTIQGTVRILNGDTTIPLAGALVTCSHASYYMHPHCTGTVSSAADGSYSFGSVFLHDTDRIAVQVEATGYQTQTVTRSGLETYYNPTFDFVLSP